MSKLHVYTDDEESVVASSVADAIDVMTEFAGAEIWGPESGIEVEQVPDEQMLTIIDGESGKRERKTAAEWAREQGRGYLCGPI